MAGRFDGKVAIVTGAAVGMGAAIARRLAAEGAAVGALDVHEPRDTTAAIEAAGGRALPLVCDVRNDTSVSRAVETVVEAFERLDLLVNNAGVIRYGEVPDFAEEEWDLVLDTNVKGIFLLSKHAIPHMRRAGGGAIVNTASVQAFATQKLVAAYTASKGAVVAMTRTMALDHARDRIRVNAIAPGSVRTPMLRFGAETFAPDDPDAELERWGRDHPIERVIEPEEVAQVVAFLLSDDASAVTGATYLVDGGLLAKVGI